MKSLVPLEQKQIINSQPIGICSSEFLFQTNTGEMNYWEQSMLQILKLKKKNKKHLMD